MRKNRDKESEDGISFDYIYEQYRHSMFGIAYAILHDSHAAEDITSECLFKISETIDRIKYLPEREIQDYIATIVKNRSIDLYRKRQKHPEYSIDDQWNVEDHSQSEDTMISQVGYQQLVEAIDRLPETHRNILKLRYLYDLSFEELSQLLEIGHSAVQQRIRRAKQQLENLLEEERYFDGK